MKLFAPQVSLSSEDYEKLLKCQKQAQTIIANREFEVRSNQLRYEHGEGKALFLTRDGLEAVGQVPKGCWSKHFKTQCRSKQTGGIVEDSPSFEPHEVRHYEFRGEYRMGMPVYHEI